MRRAPSEQCDYVFEGSAAYCYIEIHRIDKVKNQIYRGVAQLVARLLWECRGCIRDRVRRNAAKPCDAFVCGISPGCRKRHKSGFDHRNDHRQKKLYFYPSLWYHGRNWISGYSEVGIAPGLGPGDRAFEPHYSDQNPSEIVDFRGFFLILCLLRRKHWVCHS